MQISDLIRDLMPIGEAAKLAQFRSAQGFRLHCKKDPGAPRIIALTPGRHFVLRSELHRWISTRVGFEVTA